VIGFFVLYCQLNGVPSVNLIGGNIGTHGTSLSSLFELGLIAGMVSFGGAYVTLPFIYAAAVVGDQWLTERQFLDALAITNVLPCPLVTFVTMVGWVGHGIAGAVVMTIGIFLPAFSFTIIGHEFFELVVHIAAVHPFLDGIGAAVIGFLALTAFQFIKAVIVTGIDAVVFFLALGATFMFTDKYTQPGIILVAAIAGQILYDN
jgi:chromate transporter